MIRSNHLPIQKIGSCGRRAAIQERTISDHLGRPLGIQLFVWQMVERYEKWSQRVFGPSMIFLEPTETVLHNHAHQHVRMEVSTHLAFAGVFQRLSLAAALAGRSEHEQLSAMPASGARAQTNAVRVCEFVHRVFARGERDELVSPMRTDRRPVLRVFARSTAAPSGNDAPWPSALMPGVRQAGEPLAASTKVQTPQIAAAHDVTRLADQVLKVIDNRIVAHRERLGRL